MEERLTIRLSEQDKKTLETEAKNYRLSMSSYVRTKLFTNQLKFQ